jgi:hypothetical protein
MDFLNNVIELLRLPLQPLFSFYTLLSDTILSSTTPALQSRDSDAFTPQTCTVSDILETHSILTSLGLPAELANMVLHQAEYWVGIRIRRAQPLPLTSGPFGAACPYLETPALGAGGQFAGLPLVRLQRVVFRIVSRDQGWVSDRTNVGTYNGAYSWFEACIWRKRRLSGQQDDDGGGGDRMVIAGTQVEVSPLESLLLGDVPTFPGPGTQGFSGSPSVFITPDPSSVRDVLGRRGWDFVPVPPVEMLEVDEPTPDSRSANRGQEEEKFTWLIQRNIVASRAMLEHEVIWNRDDEVMTDEEYPENGRGLGRGFLASIDTGDRIGVWARCMVSLPKLQLQLQFFDWH